jgi:hypothetical protein
MSGRLVLPLFAVLLLTACESREVEKDLEIVGVETGWYDIGVQLGGTNKLVPSVSLELENVSDRDIASVQLMTVFRRIGEEQSWGEHYVRAIDHDGLAAGSTTDRIVLRSTLGYTGPQSRLQMLQNAAFVDATVEVFGKHGRRTWVKMAEFSIERELLTR